MEVKAGFKQTDVGIIPDDWEFTSVEQLVNKGILAKPLDGNHGEIHPKSSDYVSYGIPFVMANNVQNGHVDLENCSFIRKEQADRLRIGFSYPGDVLLTHKATIGNTAIVGNIPFEYIMLTPQVTYYRVADKKKLNNKYLRHFFDSSAFQKVMSSKSGGGTRAYIGIGAQLQLPVVLPSTLAEQEAIAEALSDADALIEALERLIAKKRQVKRGAMQDLLTGKKRLPEFTGEWAVKKIGEIAFPSSEKNEAGDDLPVLTCSKHLGFVDSLSYFKNQVFSSDTRGYKVITRGQIGYPANHVEEGSIGLQDLYDVAIVSPIYVVFSVIDEVDSYFLHRLLKLDAYRQKFAMETNASVDRRGSLRWPAFSQITVKLPSLQEQTAIAEILSDMDAEIASVEAKLVKARQVKQGMMSLLLTGRVRLV